MKAVDLLKQARELIADPAHWTTGTLARDKKGIAVLVDNKAACSFCALGAIYRTKFDACLPGTITASAIMAVSDEAFQISGHSNLTSFNDNGATHSEVLEAFDRAIERLENEE